MSRFARVARVSAYRERFQTFCFAFARVKRRACLATRGSFCAF